MEEVVKYFCRQADYHYGAHTGFKQELLCTVEEGANCIGISSHVLNSKTSAFLSYRHPRKPEPRYEIHWTCDSGLLYPQVIVKGRGPYIGTKTSEPGILTPQAIGRKYCPSREDARLKLQKCEKADSQKMVNQAALWHDQFPLFPGSRNAMRSLILMAIVEEIQSVVDAEILSSAENSLLLFFAPDTIFSLKEYICQEADSESGRVALSFFSTYCSFLLELLPQYSKNELNTIFFSRCFERYWKINLNDILRDLINNPDNVHRQLGQIPNTGKTFPRMLKETLSECVEAVVYDNRIRAMNRIYQKLKKVSDKSDSVAQSQLDIIQSYLNVVVHYHPPSRAG